MSPTEKVKEAIKQGKSNPVEIAKATGLGQGTVEVILAHLERSAELVRDSLTSCPTGGCGSCAQAKRSHQRRARYSATISRTVVSVSGEARPSSIAACNVRSFSAYS